MMKAFSFFLLLFALASTQGFSQVSTPVAAEEKQVIQEQRSENHALEASVSSREQAERDLLVPRKYQEQLAAEADKPIKYGPSNSSRKKYYGRSSSRKKYYGKRRSSSRRRR